MKSILTILPEQVFANEINIPEHAEYIKSGNYYEHYYELSSKLQPLSILEIGVRFGYSLCSMFAGCNNKNVYIEGWDLETYVCNSTEIAKNNLIKCGAKNINLYILNSQHKLKLDRNFDLIHIDGDHSYEGKMHDLKLITGYCKYLIVDDYNYLPEVRKACLDYLSEYQDKYILKTEIINSYRGTLFIEFK